MPVIFFSFLISAAIISAVKYLAISRNVMYLNCYFLNPKFREDICAKTLAEPLFQYFQL